MEHADSVTLVGSGAVIVSSATIEDALRRQLTTAVSVEDSLGAIVAALSAHVRTLPSLVCAIHEPEGIRVLLRGTAEALVSTETGEQRIAPGSVSTWAEHMLPGSASLVLRHAPGGSPVILPGGVSRASAPPAPVADPPAPVPDPPAPVPDPPAAAADRSQAGAILAPEPPSSVGDPADLSSSTLAWLGDGVPGGGAAALPTAGDDASKAGAAGADAAAEPLPPPADDPVDPADEILGDPVAEEPDPTPVALAPAADPAGVDDDPFGFRHLLDETMHVSTEEAAVRPPPEDHEDDVPAPAATAEPEPQPEPAAEAVPEPAPIPLPIMTGGGLIDSVPGASLRPAGEAAPVAAPALSAAGTGGAPPAPAGAPPAPAGAPAIRAGAPFASAAVRPPVQAVLCDLGHPNPVIASECRTCRRPLTDRTPRTVPRPSLGRLVFTDGMVTELDSPVLIGRAPAESMAAPDLRETPKLLSLPSQDKRISRLHAEIRLEGWQVYVLDSSSLNGTTVMQPGLPPRQLRSGEPCLVEPGSSVNLGGAVTFTFEGPGS